MEAPGVEASVLECSLVNSDARLAVFGEHGVTLSDEVWERLVSTLGVLAKTDARAGELLCLLLGQIRSAGAVECQ